MNLSKIFPGNNGEDSTKPSPEGSTKTSPENFNKKSDTLSKIPKEQMEKLISVMDKFHSAFGDNAEKVTLTNEKSGYTREIMISKHSITIYTRQRNNLKQVYNTKKISFGIIDGKIIANEMNFNEKISDHDKDIETTEMNFNEKISERNIDIETFTSEMNSFIDCAHNAGYEKSVKPFGDTLYENSLSDLRKKEASFPKDLKNNSVKFTIEENGKSTDLIIGADKIVIKGKDQGKVSMTKNGHYWVFNAPDSETQKMSSAGKRAFVLGKISDLVNKIVYGTNYKMSVEPGESKNKKANNVVISDNHNSDNHVDLNEKVVVEGREPFLLYLANRMPGMMRIPLIKSLIREEKMRREKERWEKIRNGEVKEKELTDKENLVKNAVKWWSDRIDSLSNVATTESPMADAIRVIARSNKEESSEVQIKKFKIELAYELSEELERNYKESNGKKYRCYIETDLYPTRILRKVVDKIGISESAFPEKYTMEIDLLRKTVTYRNRLNLPNTYTLIKL